MKRLIDQIDEKKRVWKIDREKEREWEKERGENSNNRDFKTGNQVIFCKNLLRKVDKRITIIKAI